MGYRFRDWFACPECGHSDDVSALAHKNDIVFECYGCGLTSEFVFGKDIGLKDLDPDAIADAADEQTTD